MRFAFALTLALLAPPAIDLESALRAKDWAAARAILTREVEANPGRPLPAYNLACVEARGGRAEAALDALLLAAERGFAFTATLLRDEDLDAVRGSPRYPAILARVRENNAKALEVFRPRAEKANVLLYPPPDRSRPAPLVVALHGSGGTAAEFAPHFVALARELGAALAVPEGLNRAGSGFDWGVVEQGSLLIELAIERAKKQYAVDPARVVLAGFSNGASTAFVLALQKPADFAGVVAMAGAYDERVAPVPAGVRLPRFAILVGERDRDAPLARKGAAELKARGGAVRLRVYEGVGHQAPPDTKSELRAALRFVLEPGAPAPAR